MEIQVSVIIPVYNQWQYTRDCLESLRAHTDAEGLEVLVVDNGSSDETEAACPVLGRKLFNDAFTYLRNETNLNFAGGCNRGARHASGGILLFLNNDTLLTENWLPPLVRALDEDSNLGAVGPLLLYPGVGPLEDRVQHLGIACRPQLYPIHLFEYFPADHPAVRAPRRYQALTAAALAVPRALFFEAGGFHEGFINGGEDVDLCCGLRRLGYELTCELSSRVYHYASQTPGRHDHEQHNGRLLKERSMDMLVPDLHLHGARHGYELALSSRLVDMLRVPEKRGAYYVRRFAGVLEHGSVAELTELLDREPLFEPVYERLAVRYHDAGRADHAAHMLLVRAKLFPIMANVQALIVQAELAGMENLREYGLGLRQHLRNIPCNADLGELARSMAEFSDTIHQPALSSVYRRSLAAMGEGA